MNSTDEKREEQRLAAVQRHQAVYKKAAAVTRNNARIKRLAELTEKAARLGISDGYPLGIGVKELANQNSGGEGDSRMSWADRMQQQHNEANNPRVEEQLGNVTQHDGQIRSLEVDQGHVNDMMARERNNIDIRAQLKTLVTLEEKVAKLMTMPPPDVVILQKNLKKLNKLKTALSTRNDQTYSSQPIIRSSENLRNREIALQNKISTLLTTQQRALSILETIEEDTPLVKQWISKATKVFQSLEHLIPTILEEWNDIRDKLGKLVQLCENLKVTCDQSLFQSNKINGLITELTVDWGTLAELKQAYFAKDKKIVCSICLVQDVDYVLACGHPFCGNCVEHMTICASCRKPIYGMTRIYWQM
ncbi:uncharacterized protein LOC110861184 isoform X2 [Folsomia candida]|uniref:uncharacterized protein LOC110861184 isoform X2 n=1 Tax=Folsomia candida TaxID=158441 RepID=UPI001604C709|nr:uncharacterized protein LOC110861184 isoform X2 [Folsomia candida]